MPLLQTSVSGRLAPLTEVSSVDYTAADGKFHIVLSDNLVGNVEVVAKPPDVWASPYAEGPLSPSPDTASEDPVDARMQRRDRRERTLDDPVDASLRKSGPDVRNHRQVVHDVRAE